MDLSKLYPVMREVESANNPLAVSRRGAVGTMQTMPDTLKKPGLGVKPAMNDSPEERQRVGEDYITALIGRYGNLPHALAAYNWGLGNVDDWKKAGGDTSKLPAETRDYVAKITSRVGLAGTGDATPVGPRDFAARIEGYVRRSIQRPSSANWERLAAERESEAAKLAEETRPNLLEMTGAALKGNADQWAGDLISHIWRDEFPAEEGFKPNFANVPLTADRDLLEQYAGAKSPAQAASILAKHEEEQFRVKTVMDRGAVLGMGLSFAAEVGSVTNWVTGVGTAVGFAKVGVGAIALATEGRTGAALLSSMGENALSGTAVEALRSYTEGKLHAKDVGINLAADALIGLATGGFTVRAGGIARAERALTQARNASMAESADLMTRAERELGVGATESQLIARANQLRTSDASAPAAAAMAPVREKLTNTGMQPFDPKAATLDEARAIYGEAIAPKFEDTNVQAARVRSMETRRPWQKGAEAASDGEYTYAAAKALPSGVTATSVALRDVEVAAAIPTLRALAKEYVPTAKVVVGTGYAKDNNALGAVLSAGDVHFVGLASRPGEAASVLNTGIHEIGHIVVHQEAPNVPASIWESVNRDWLAFVENARQGTVNLKLKDSVLETRFAVTSEGRGQEFLPSTSYGLSRDEYLAEQFIKHIQQRAVAGELGHMEPTIVESIVKALRAALDFVLGVKRKGLLSADEGPEALFRHVLSATAKNRKLADSLLDPAMQLDAASYSISANTVNNLLTDPDAVKFGMATIPVDTTATRQDAMAMLALHKEADAWELKNPMDDAWKARAKNLADNNVFNVASTGLVMLTSPSPLVRMIAAKLVEDASGVAGKRGSTAAISKYIMERKMMHNTINDVQGAYALWKVGKPGGWRDDLIGGKNWDAFNHEIASEIEARRVTRAPVTQDGNVKAAADSIEAAYARAANAQKEAKTLGWAAIPPDSIGYMPHRMSPKAVMNMSNAQKQVVHDALVDQFVTIEGWDLSFADKLAARYVDRVRHRASGDYGSHIAGSSSGTADIIEEALSAMKLPADVIKTHMENFTKGAANFTKGRIDLDLNKVYTLPEGEFKLMGIFETNQIELLRSQVQRASGEVALAKHGVLGKPGLQLLRNAMLYGEDGKRAMMRDKEAFDQMAAEFMGAPFGEHGGKWLDRAMAANTLVRLGGIAFNQLAESINGVFHVGAARTMHSIAAMPRLRAEIQALARGEKVDNSIIGSIEHSGGAEFGTDAYKIVMPFDSADHAYPTYGQDTLGVADRLLRGGGHVQAKLSGWRMVHSAQQRGMAEQIVHKMARYMREGKDDIALEQFGFNAEVRKAVRGELDQIAKFDGDRLVSFDVTKISDPDIREQVIHAVWRGTSQIIQGTFIGEKGKWAHDGMLKLMTQFRTFSITSMEKQWGRQRNSHGAYAAYGMIIGAMSMAAPIYYARTYAASIGRPDQEKYLDERLQPERVARATLNYIAMGGMASDFVDMTTSLMPESLGVKPTGGRSGVETDFVGNYIVPASSLVNDIWKYAQSPDKLEDAVKIMPFSRLPYLIPLLNETKEE